MKHSKKDLAKLKLFLEQVPTHKPSESESKFKEACATIKLYSTLLSIYEKPLGRYPDAQTAVALQLAEIGNILQEMIINLKKSISK